MSNDPKTTAKSGDWVLVWGQVVTPDVIPGETEVRFEDHNSDYVGGIRNAHLVLDQGLPPGVEKCTSVVRVYDDERPYLTPCARHLGHQGKHDDHYDNTWTSDVTVGHLERA